MRLFVSALATAAAFVMAPSAMASTVVGNTTTFTPADVANFGISGNVNSGPFVAGFQHVGAGLGTLIDIYQFTVDQAGSLSATLTSGAVSSGSAVDTDLLAVFVNDTPATLTANADGSVTWSVSGIPVVSGLMNTISVTYFTRGLFSYGGNATFVPSPSQSAVPEPATWALMLAGFAVVGAAMRRRGAQHTVRARFNVA